MILMSKILTNVVLQLSVLIINISITTCACCRIANPHHVFCDDVFLYFNNRCSYVVIMFIKRTDRKSVALLCWRSYIAS